MRKPRGIGYNGRTPAGICRWCETPILREDGEPNRRRNWHPECVEEWKIANSSTVQRMHLWRRDRGVCAACRFDCTTVELLGWEHVPDAFFPRLWLERHAVHWDGKAPFSPVKPVERLLRAWEADHRVPLWSIPEEAPRERHRWARSLENLQTLCEICHREKTAREAAHRSSLRRDSRQLAIELPAAR